MIRFHGTVQVLGVLDSRRSSDGKMVFYKIAALASRQPDKLAPSTGEPFDCFSISLRLKSEDDISKMFEAGQVCYVSGTIRTFVGTRNNKLNVIHNLDTSDGEFTPLHTIPLTMDIAGHLAEYANNNRGAR